jgi:hypothetical protein
MGHDNTIITIDCPYATIDEWQMEDKSFHEELRIHIEKGNVILEKTAVPDIRFL